MDVSDGREQLQPGSGHCAQPSATILPRWASRRFAPECTPDHEAACARLAGNFQLARESRKINASAEQYPGDSHCRAQLVAGGTPIFFSRMRLNVQREFQLQHCGAQFLLANRSCDDSLSQILVAIAENYDGLGKERQFICTAIVSQFGG